MILLLNVGIISQNSHKTMYVWIIDVLQVRSRSLSQLTISLPPPPPPPESRRKNKKLNKAGFKICVLQYIGQYVSIGMYFLDKKKYYLPSKNIPKLCLAGPHPPPNAIRSICTQFTRRQHEPHHPSPLELYGPTIAEHVILQPCSAINIYLCSNVIFRC